MAQCHETIYLQSYSSENRLSLSAPSASSQEPRVYPKEPLLYAVVQPTYPAAHPTERRIYPAAPDQIGNIDPMGSNKPFPWCRVLAGLLLLAGVTVAAIYWDGLTKTNSGLITAIMVPILVCIVLCCGFYCMHWTGSHKPNEVDYFGEVAAVASHGQIA
ncbi:hypothetical protein HDU91_002335 [Kappamyces sp. JEL0680]|nr:hypothetical protein HDU91_002335 [Kappamyces sp. JEL0680]